jgi:hypothetical protein
MLLTGIMVASLVLTGAAPTRAPDVHVHTGVIDGARYRVEVPSNWNGTLLLYNHGIYPSGVRRTALGRSRRDFLRAAECCGGSR